MIFKTLNCLGSEAEYKALVFPLYQKYGQKVVRKAMSILSDKRLLRQNLWDMYQQELAPLCAKIAG